MITPSEILQNTLRSLYEHSQISPSYAVLSIKTVKMLTDNSSVPWMNAQQFSGFLDTLLEDATLSSIRSDVNGKEIKTIVNDNMPLGIIILTRFNNTVINLADDNYFVINVCVG